jgi:ATP-dependent Clp protease protease subunit
MPEAVVVKFYSPVSEASIGSLMKVVDQKLAAGVTQFTVLISTSGGSVFHGLTAYNYLKGIPAEVTTHNIGSVDSIGVALFCAGRMRLSVPQARFLMHPVSMNFREGASYEEPKLVELVKSLRVDMDNCASVVAANTKKTRRQVFRAGAVCRGRRGHSDPVGRLTPTAAKIPASCSPTQTLTRSLFRSGRCTCAGTGSCTWSVSWVHGGSGAGGPRCRARPGSRPTSTT